MKGQTNADKIIEELGGCGRFQITMNIICHAMKIITTFSFSSMIVISFTPTWWCTDHITPDNLTACAATENSSDILGCPNKACSINGTRCSNIQFGGTMRTLVSEFGLVCDLDYIPSLIMSIQLGGTLAGNLMAGHIAEYIGRKKPFFASILIFIVGNLVGYFTVSWVMFAITRVFIGLAAGFFMTTKYSLLCEFSSAKWRVWIIGFPSWPIQACVFALVAWLLQDWRNIQLMIAILGVPFLLPWFIIPESFRWYIAHDKVDQAKQIIEKVAATNKREIHDLENLLVQPSEDIPGRKYTFLDLFKTKTLVRVTILSSINWLALGLVSYAIGFGIQSLSGKIFLNMFLFAIVGIPSKGADIWLQNKIGRRKSAVLCFSLVAVGGYVVGIVQSIDAPNKGAMTNGFALVAYIGITTAWGPVQTMTIELYPTVIRPIGFGTLSVIGRVGGIIGPQLVYLNLRVPGVMYFVLGVVGTLCIIGCFGLPETKDGTLSDKMENKTNAVTVENKRAMIQNSDTNLRQTNTLV